MIVETQPTSAIVRGHILRFGRRSLAVSYSVLLSLAMTDLGAAQPMPHQVPLAPPPAHPIRPDLDRFPLVKAYDLGPIDIEQPALAREFPTMPVPLTGGIAVPAGTGPFPWVIVLHGRHAGCHLQVPAVASQWPCPPEAEPRYDLGFAYLAQALAESGYGVLMVNLNGAFSHTYGANSANGNRLAEQRSLQIINAHLQRLAAAHRGEAVDFGVPLAGQVDLNRLAMVGHSMGGGMAALSALQRLNQTDRQSVQAGQGPIASLVLLSPTRSEGIAEHPETYRLPDVPTSVVMGACDRDIFDFSSLYYFETAVQNVARRTPATAVLLLGGNHNFFNATVPKDDYYRRPDNALLCNPQQSPQRLSRVEQETFLKTYVRDFLTVTLGQSGSEQTLAALGLLAHRAAPAQIYSAPVLTNLALPSATTQPIFKAEVATAADSPSQPAIVADGVSIERCVALHACGSHTRSWPQFPTVLALRWAQPGGRLGFSWGDGQSIDVSRLDSLQLRLALEPNANGEPAPAFAVVLRDQVGNAVRVEIPPTTPALRPWPPDPAHQHTAGPVYPSSVRIPLPQFRGVDLTAVTTVELVFDQAAPGALHLASLEFIGQPPPMSWATAPATAAGEF